MKEMTCKQLGGACDFEIQGESFDEMVEKSKAHGKEMAKLGDEAHLKIMGEMMEMMNDPEAIQKMFEKVKKEFDALPNI